jgi:hypothetical protein
LPAGKHRIERFGHIHMPFPAHPLRFADHPAAERRTDASQRRPMMNFRIFAIAAALTTTTTITHAADMELWRLDCGSIKVKDVRLRRHVPDADRQLLPDPP